MADSYMFLLITLCFTGVRCKTGQRGGPWVRPETFVDNYKSFITFECTALMGSKQLLSWYQIKTNESKPVLLAITQQEYFSGDNKIRNSVNLYKTLELSDNGSKIYCALQNVLPGGTFSEIAVSNNIYIVFNRKIQPFDPPFIYLEPKDKVVYFDANTTLYFNCTGSKPINGRSYTWFMKNLNSKLILPLSQRYDRSTNLNQLVLPVNESYHGYKLFCAQEFHLYINQTDNSLRRKKYGELVRSDLIIIVQRGKVDIKHILGLVLPVLLVAIASVIIAMLWLKLRRSQEDSLDSALVTDENDAEIYNSNYATAPVTYAVLDLEQSDPADPYATAAHATPVQPDARNYVGIIGVLKPKADTRK